MLWSSSRYFLQVAPLLFVLGGCATLRPAEDPLAGRPAPESHTLTLIVSELQMHLDDDTYRTNRAVSSDGRNVFTLALWRIERLQRQRDVIRDEPENVDIVLEYARGRALERLRRFSKAADAYDNVSDTGSLLAEPASQGAEVMRRFAQVSGRPEHAIQSPAEELVFIEERIARWRDLAWSYRSSAYEPLALEEWEAWEMLRVDWFARHRPLQEGIEACHRLAERHRSSKRYAKHMIRLGDLYARAARQAHLRSRARLDPFDASRYEAFLDQAFSAYELAGDDRKPEWRREAQSKIDALLAYHQGTLGHAE